jgi:predicted amidophosphoribosyltransferase
MPEKKICKHCGKPNLTDGKYCCDQCETGAAREERLRIQNINDYYDPAGARLRRQRQRQIVNALSEVFVGGMPYTDDE